MKRTFSSEKQMKLWAAALAFVVLLAAPPASPAQPQLPQIFINDREVSLPFPAEVQNGVLVAPLSPLIRAFGGSVAWDARAMALTAVGISGLTVRLTVGQDRAESGDTAWDLPVAPTLRDGTFVGPVAAVLRAIGAYVKEDDSRQTLDAVSQVTAVTWRRDSGALSVTVSATGPVHADSEMLHSPERVIIDLSSAVTRLPASEELGDPDVLRVRSAQFQVHPFITRLVFDVTRPMTTTFDTNPGTVVVAFRGTTAAAQQAPAPPGPPDPHTWEAAQGSPSSTNPSGPAALASAATPRAGASSQPQDVPDAPEPLALPPLPEFADAPGAFHVSGVTYEDPMGVGRVMIHASQPFSYTMNHFVYPERLAIDIPGGVFLLRRLDLEVGSDAVRNIVVSQFRLRPNLTRVIIHLKHATWSFASARDGGRTLVVSFGDAGRSVAQTSPVQTPPTPAPPAPTPSGATSPRVTPPVEAPPAQTPPDSTPSPARPRPSGFIPVVIIDPGHGGDDPGAIGPGGLHEADVALAIGRMVGEILVHQGLQVQFTRTGDTTVPLEDRPDIVKRFGGAVFVSIHANASQNPDVTGTETYYKTADSQSLAALVQSEVVAALGEPDRGIRTADFYVIVNAGIPSVLVETAFITNPKEERLLRDPSVQRRIAEAIARAIARFLTVQPEDPTSR
jgi:N-acetylmuramoyl-L-alanine amidase